MSSTTDSSSDHFYYEIDIASIVIILFLAVATVFSNGAFLWTFYKDPLKCLRTPSTIFIAGLTSANFVSGLVVEPAFVAYYFRHFMSHSKNFLQFFRLAQAFAFMTTTTSFLVILALGIVQYLLIKFPGVYQKIVSPKSALVGTVVIWIYSIIFGMIPVIFNVDRVAYSLTNLVLHIILPTILLVILYISIYYEFRERYQDANLGERTERQGPSVEPTESVQQRRQAQKDFAFGTFILTLVLIILVLPFCVTLFMVLCCVTASAVLAVRIAQLFLLWKFALDPFLFAWRFRKFRTSLVLAMRGTCLCPKPSLPGATYVRENAATSPKSDVDDEELEVTVVANRD